MKKKTADAHPAHRPFEACESFRVIPERAAAFAAEFQSLPWRYFLYPHKVAV
jgi:hypothetical protein